MMNIRTLLMGILVCFAAGRARAQRKEISIDKGWRFALGHASDASKDFGHGTAGFSYFAKAGYGDGPAAAGFDDRSWRVVDLPHDWAVELPFDPQGSHSHGYRAMGRNFPENSVGWYRKFFFVQRSEEGRRFVIRFDGVFRDSRVWVNGFYLGNEQGGYNGFSYDITDYLKYGGENCIAVRADASMEEGWFYEGAGIYRHVWLVETGAAHVAENGVCVRTGIEGAGVLGAGVGMRAPAARVEAGISLVNDGGRTDTLSIRETILDGNGKEVAMGRVDGVVLSPRAARDVSCVIHLAEPRLWSVDDPYLYKVVTSLWRGGMNVDSCITSLGVRQIRWDADSGFFLNGRPLKLKGTNDHQDHAGVGVAAPDGLWEYRIRCLKAIGSNAYRCAHNPPAPELLDACDRLGVLVIDENRWMGTTPQITDPLRRMILRDRNHPSVIAWSIGNEEWAMEGTETGARVASTMQDYVHRLDSTRPVTVAVSGGWGKGISTVADVMGFNYIAQGSTDEQHAHFPRQPGMGTEEGQTTATRGVYVDDPGAHQIASYDRPPMPGFYSLESGWKHYASRPYLAGMFVWSGFDYRGEPSPFGWPSVSSYTGMLDVCGYPKDIAWYFRSWWTEQPVLHLLPHWNWPGREGQPIAVWAYSNCEEVELFLNGKSQGRRQMLPNGHAEWSVGYRSGVLEAIGYKGGKKVLTDVVRTTGKPVRLVLKKDFSGGGVSVVRVKAVDAAGNAVPVADNEVFFDVSGPARIIGVGNGDPVSHEADKYIERVVSLPVGKLQAKVVTDGNGDGYPEIGDAGWRGDLEKITDDTTATVVAYKGDIELPELPDGSVYRLFYKSIGKGQRVYLNGRLLGRPVDEMERSEFPVDNSILRKGKNELVVIARPFRKRYRWDAVNYDPGVLQVVVPAAGWKRRLFNGLAQVIVEDTGKAGDVTLTAVSKGLESDEIQTMKSRAGAGRSTVSLPRVFGDNMVLQRGIAIPVWGRASPGAEVIGKLGTMAATAKADREGKWMVHFPKMAAGGPYILEIAEEGKPGTRVEFKNILIGDVWVASGQSNMEWQVQQASNARQEILKASYPDMRYLIVEHDKRVTPQTDIETMGWEACDTNSVKRLSAVAYFFARRIHGDEHVPIGIIQTTWGGTPIQAWTSREKLLSSPVTRDGLRATDTLSESQFVQDSINTMHFWDVIDHPQNRSDKVIPMPDYDDSGWARVEMPRTLDHFGIGSFEGIMWLRKKVVLPDAFAGRSLVLALGHPEVSYSLYFNGVEISRNVWNVSPVHSYPIPGNLVRKGENTVAIRMAMLWGAGGLEQPAEGIYLSDGDARISLAGEWRYNKDLEPAAPLHNYQYYPTVLFNAMVNPLIPYGIKGIIWYQGEANAGEAYNYRKLFPMMIADWRERWNRGDLPFLFAQLANFMGRKPVPSESDWAELREAQAMTLSLPRTAMACTIDIGDGATIHPTDKQDVGLRLALGAENLVYGRRGIASGPVYKSYSVGGDRMVIRFSSVGSGLTTRDGRPITGFAIAGDDREWHWADAVVEGNDVIVHSDQVAKPVAVRYAWADNPDCNLVNKEGLPAVPFRTDDWKGITQRKY